MSKTTNGPDLGEIKGRYHILLRRNRAIELCRECGLNDWTARQLLARDGMRKQVVGEKAHYIRDAILGQVEGGGE